MRAIALLGLLVWLAWLTAATAGAEPLLGRLDDPVPLTQSTPHVLPDDLPPEVVAEARRILERRFRITITALRFASMPKALGAVLLRPVLGAEDQTLLRRAIRSGDLELEHVATVSGRVEDPLEVTSGHRRHVVAVREMESAEGAVAAIPTAQAVRSGLRASLRLSAVAGRGVRLGYAIVLADEPVVTTIDEIGGDVDRVAQAVARARGALRLAPGETAPILFESDDGAGALVLIRLDGPDETLPAVRRFAAGHVLAVGGHLADGIVVSPSWERADGWFFENDGPEENDTSRQHHWDVLLELPGRSDPWWDLPGGLRAGQVGGQFLGELEATLSRGAEIRGTRSVLEIRRPGFGRVRLPLGPGEAFGMFRGIRRSVRGETEVQSGCQDSSAAMAGTDVTREGLAASGRAGVDGTVDVRLIGRTVLATEWRDFRLTRVVSGYRKLEQVPFRLPLVTDALLEVHGALPKGGGSLPGDVMISWFRGASGTFSSAGAWSFEADEPRRPIGGSGWLVPEPERRELAERYGPVGLIVNGQALSVRPDREARLVDVRRRARITSWRSEGWCGMRVRHPVRSARGNWFRIEDELWTYEMIEGTRLRLTLVPGADDLELHLLGEMGSPPEDPIAFDPGDGAVEIVRNSRLLVMLGNLPLGGGGMVATGAGLSLSILRPARPAGFGPHRRVVCRTPEGETLLRTGAGGRVEAGGRMTLPDGFAGYSSNHELGEANTSYAPVRDGVRLAVITEDDDDRLSTPGALVVRLAIAAPPTWRDTTVRVLQAPRRSDGECRTLIVGRRTTRRLFLTEPDGGLRAASAAGSPLPYEIELTGDGR